MQVASDKIISANQSLAGDWVSRAMPLEHIIMFTIQLEFTGPLTGAFYLECSSEPFELYKFGKEPSTWTVIDGSNQSIVEAGDHTWLCEDSAFSWVRVRWTATSGSGTLTKAMINAKGL